MQHSRFSEQQMAFVLDHVARGASVERTCRAAGIPEQTYYRWRAKYGGMKPADICRLHEVEDENKRLKRLLASLLVAKPTQAGTALALPPAPRSTSLVPVPAAASMPGFPTDAGFALKLAEPVPPGTVIDVRFANGRPLSGSPCTP